MRTPNSTPEKPVKSMVKQPVTEQEAYRHFDFKQFPQHVFGAHVIPFMRGSDIHNFVQIANSIRCALWEDLPFLFKGEEGQQQLEQYLANPKCLTPLATMYLRQYMYANYSSAITAGDLALPAITSLHKRAKTIDLLAIKNNFFITFLRNAKGLVGHSFSESILYFKACTVTAIYDHLSLPTILKALQIPDSHQARNAAQRKVYADFVALNGTQDPDRAQRTPSQLSRCILATGGGWISEFSFSWETEDKQHLFLHGDAHSGWTSLTDRLIRSGVHSDISNRSRRTPLHHAAKYGHLNVMRRLVKAGANINLKDASGKTPLVYAILRRQSQIVDHLMTQEGADIDCSDKSGRHSLHYACKYDCPSVAHSLVEQGLGINARDPDGLTPLHYACKYNHPTIARWIVEKGGNINTRDYSNLTPLHYACKHYHSTIACWIVKKGGNVNARSCDEFTPLHYACRCTNLNVVKRLIEAGADINCKEDSGRTPLLCAIQHRHLPIANYLMMQEDLDVSCSDKFNQNSLHYAFRYNCPTIVQSLIERGIDVDATDFYGFTPLRYAYKYNQSAAIVCKIVEKGGSVDARDHNELTPLHYACKCNQIQAATSCIQRGANVNAKDYAGCTPLHYASRQHRSKNIVSLLLASKADINAQNKQGETPLTHAIFHRADLKTLELLIAQGGCLSLQFCIKNNLLQKAEYTFSAAQKLIWYDIMGKPPYDNEKANYIHFLASMHGINSSFQASLEYFREAPHLDLILCNVLYRRLPLISPKCNTIYTQIPSTISPQDVFSLLSQHSPTYIRKIFGHTVLNLIERARVYRDIAKTVKDSSVL